MKKFLFIIFLLSMLFIPNFSSGNVVVTPTSGKVMSQVTINKDSNLIADNIKKDVTVYGITGTSFIAIELTQAQYDALSTKDSNTYYLIVEEWYYGNIKNI